MDIASIPNAIIDTFSGETAINYDAVSITSNVDYLFYSPSDMLCRWQPRYFSIGWIQTRLMASQERRRYRDLRALGIFFFVLVSIFGTTYANESLTETSDGLTSDAPKHFTWTFNWDHVEATYTVTLWILLASVAKILFHVNKTFGDALPDSACLIVVGCILGALLTYFNVSREFFNLDSTVFFLYLLPPIVFDAGYFMPNRALFENIESVMLFAIVGTIFNTITIGATLYYCGMAGFFGVEFNLFEIMLFAALISAVDPVAVIAVFEETNVNVNLFVNVFGEAIFNDGVAIVLYTMFLKFGQIGVDNMHASDYVAGGASFFVIALGGVLIGLVFAFIVSFITRFITPSTRVVAPVFIFLFPYLSYLTAEACSVSSILAIVTCGIFMKEYVKQNITHEATISVKYFTKMIAQCAETVVFVFLGLSTVTSEHQWDWAFIAITIASCLIFRTIGVIVQCAFLNLFRKKKFTAIDQFMLAYGGLRGAIAFGLVVSMPLIAAKKMFVTTTMAVIIFTVGFQGTTIKPLVKKLRIELKNDEADESVIEKVYTCYFDMMMTCIENVTGQKGSNDFREKYEIFNQKVLRPILTNHPKKDHDPNVEKKVSPIQSENLIRKCAKITLRETLDSINIHRKISFHKTAKETPVATGAKEVVRTRTASGSEVGISVNELENLFSAILDKKLREVTLAQPVETHTDIGDDYYNQTVQHNQQSASDLDLRRTEISHDPAITNLRRQKRGASSPNVHLVTGASAFPRL
uniref:Sodium/hydrogen exchanger n=1 Tax=Panagrellus redivivus TaxID=6233 RepID=A0A7E4UNE5_PANRE